MYSSTENQKVRITKDEAYKKIAQLVERFSEHVEEYKRGNYNEHQTRVDYINPFFKALGWDMDNEQGFAEAYREVIHEDKIKVGGTTKAPDYGFTLFGQRKFFVDAKKPSVNIKGDIAPAYQVRRYGWSAKVPISIVTDFEEFSIYDCTKKPKPTDKASVSRIKYLTFDQYLDEFDFLWDVFAKENLPKGRFDKYVQSDTRKKGTATVDDEFLKSIEQWRTYLATSIALRNKSLNVDELNYAVQKIIDRIIFLRMCEDRGVEQYGNLKKAAEKGDVYQNLFGLYHIADDKYNSGLFDFIEDKITPGIIIDNKVLKTIIKELYYPECEYEFSVMPADILGSVYERFLGKTIRLTPAHYAKIEEKPEVRKAGGVYYTPKYVVDYIIENTVGKLIQGKTPKQVEKIKICDPACGSGSFLIGAYQYLLDWHLKYYNENPPKKKRDNPLTPEGNLTTAEKKRILLNNIFGVDIDTQAVEVTKLNLLLKALEGETLASISQQLSLFQERVLPNLGNNIKCGNSLIGHDFYDQQLEIFPEQIKKINAFDWKEGFPEIMSPSGGSAGGGQGGLPAEASAKAGFDAVIGNPPYIPIEFFTDDEKHYYKLNYPELTRKFETSVIFILRGLEIINKVGMLGFISTQTWQTGENYKSFRKRIFEDYGLQQIINLPFNVFKDAYVDTGIFIFSKKTQSKYRIFLYDKKDNTYSIADLNFNVIQTTDIIAPDYKIIFNEQIGQLSKKFISEKFVELGHISISTQGLSASRFTKTNNAKGKWVLPFINAKVKRYSFLQEDVFLVDLENHKSLHKYYINKKKILIRRIINRQNRLDATFFNDDGVFKKDLNPFIITDAEIKTKYVLGLLNSKLFSWLYLNSSTIATKDDFRQTTLTELRKLPIRKINQRNKKELSTEEDIIKTVDNILKLNEQLQTTKLETQRQQIQRTIDHEEKKIDELVYELYGLSEEEIKIIEEN
ncbi:MAG: N-6 DNA methylase [Bacteroidales bacterium]|nr:N-6 DNA methylase [Bacteroidales bacterium]